MKRLLFILFAAVLFAPAALAKGPSEATITGPGLGKPISFKGMDDASRLTEYSGVFPAVFGQSPDPMLKGRPAGKLGPRYTIRYVVPGGNSQTFRLSQDLYPYAQAGAVTYMKPGQPIFDARTIGGWYPAGVALKELLVRAGLPKSAPRIASSSSGTNLALVAGIGIPGALALAGAALLVARRRSRA
jgi:hypothetical protein